MLWCLLRPPSLPFLYYGDGRRGFNEEGPPSSARLPTTGAINAVGPACRSGFACAAASLVVSRRRSLFTSMARKGVKAGRRIPADKVETEKTARPAVHAFLCSFRFARFLPLMHHRWRHVLYSFSCAPRERGLGHGAYTGPDPQA